MKNLFTRAGVVLATLFATANVSLAALGTDQQAVVDSIDLMLTDYISWAWGAVIVLLGFTIGAKLLKKFASKAT